MELIPEPQPHSTDPKFRDITGQKFGKLTVKYYVGRIGNGIRKYSSWYCICECGGWSVPIIQSLMSGNATTCGKCCRTRIRDEKGNRYTHKPDKLKCRDCKETLPFTKEYWYERKDKTAFGLISDQCRQCSKIRSRKRNREHNQKIRFEIMQHYSNGTFQCNYCKMKLYSHLTIDHIKEDGKQDRDKRGSWNFYQKLKDDNYPEGIQILCMTCNFIKNKFGYSPYLNPELIKLAPEKYR